MLPSKRIKAVQDQDGRCCGCEMHRHYIKEKQGGGRLRWFCQLSFIRSARPRTVYAASAQTAEAHPTARHDHTVRLTSAGSWLTSSVEETTLSSLSRPCKGCSSTSCDASHGAVLRKRP